MTDLRRCVAMRGGRLDVLWGQDETITCALGMGVLGGVGSTYNWYYGCGGARARAMCWAPHERFAGGRYAGLYAKIFAAFARGDLVGANVLIDWCGGAPGVRVRGATTRACRVVSGRLTSSMCATRSLADFCPA